MEIEVIFKEDYEVKTKRFSCYAMFGVWMANNFGEVEILDVVVEED